MERVKSLPINFFLISCGIFLTCIYFISNSQFQKDNSIISFAVTFDLTMTFTLTYYFFIVRKYKITAITVIPVYIGSLILAYFIIPSANQSYLSFFKELLVIPELFIVGFLFLKTLVVVKEFRSVNLITTDFIEQLYAGIYKATNNKFISSVFTSELSVIYYAATIWKRKKEVRDGQISFSVHQKTGYTALWFVIILMTIVETFSLHIFIGKYSKFAAWILTALSIYGIIFFIADFSSMLKRPVIVTGNLLFLRCGMRWRVIIPFEKISMLQSIKNFKDEAKEYLNISAAKQPNALIILNEFVEVKGLYGITRRANKIAFSIDDFKLLEKFYNERKNQTYEIINS